MINFLQKRQNKLLFLILGGIFLTDNVFAQSALTSELFTSATSSDDLLQSMATLMSTVINVLTFISLWILGIIGELVGTEYITGEAAMSVLLPMWRYVRDLVNIAFVLVLVGLAFTNLYSSFSEGGNWTIKEKLPKIIIAIVLVNFSSLFFRILIDAVNVGSVALFSIADSQLEANRATSVQSIIGNRSWKIIAKPEYITQDNKISANAKFNSEGIVVKDNPTPVNKYVLLTPSTPPSIDSSCETLYGNNFDASTLEKTHYVGQVLYTENFQGKDDKFKGKIAVCNSFSESINDIFCKKGDAGDEGCMFKLNSQLNEKTSQKYKKSSTAQNLFLAFGIQFIHLERLPTMAANVSSLQGVLSGALFGIIMSVAYIIALIAFFVALVTRMFVLWIAIIGSPVIVSASIMGFDQVKDGYEMFITNLIIPLKMALAFGVSFVMISGMSTMRPGTALNSGIIDFGPQLANLSLDAYGLFWQAVTIYAFWKAARWATKDSAAAFITDKLFDGAETVGGMLAKSATIENQFMSIPGDTSGTKFGISGLAQLPMKKLEKMKADRNANQRAFFKKFGALPGHKAALEEGYETFKTDTTNVSSAEEFTKHMKSYAGKIKKEDWASGVVGKNFDEKVFKGKTDAFKNKVLANTTDPFIKAYKESVNVGHFKGMKAFGAGGDAAAKSETKIQATANNSRSNSNIVNINVGQADEILTKNPADNAAKNSNIANMKNIAKSAYAAKGSINIDSDFISKQLPIHNASSTKQLKDGAEFIEEYFTKETDDDQKLTKAKLYKILYDNESDATKKAALKVTGKKLNESLFPDESTTTTTT